MRILATLEFLRESGPPCGQQALADAIADAIGSAGMVVGIEGERETRYRLELITCEPSPA